MGALLTLAFLLPIFWFKSPKEKTDQAAWEQLRTVFEGRGIAVLRDHPRCQERNLYGLYVRDSHQVVVCPRGDQSSTLRHEGWHAVQSLCLNNRDWLNSETIDRRLTTTDRKELEVLVAPDRWNREAEARAMANLNVNDYLQELERACTPKDPSATPKLP